MRNCSRYANVTRGAALRRKMNAAGGFVQGQACRAHGALLLEAQTTSALPKVTHMPSPHARARWPPFGLLIERSDASEEDGCPCQVYSLAGQSLEEVKRRRMAPTHACVQQKVRTLCRGKNSRAFTNTKATRIHENASAVFPVHKNKRGPRKATEGKRPNCAWYCWHSHLLSACISLITSSGTKSCCEDSFKVGCPGVIAESNRWTLSEE